MELYVGLLVLTWWERKKESPLHFVADTTGKFISATTKNRIHFPLYDKDEDEANQPGEHFPLPASPSLQPLAVATSSRALIFVTHVTLPMLASAASVTDSPRPPASSLDN